MNAMPNTMCAQEMAVRFITMIFWKGPRSSAFRPVAIRPQLSDEVVTAVSAGIARIQDHIGACVADGIHAGIYRQVNAREIADLAWSVLLGSLDAAEMHNNLGLGAEPLAVRTDRALTLVESALTPQVAATLRAVA